VSWLRELHNSMSYFIVLMSSLLFYKVEHSKNNEKPLTEYVCPNFWLVLYRYILPQLPRLTCTPAHWLSIGTPCISPRYCIIALN
jgi:hypothetical protein